MAPTIVQDYQQQLIQTILDLSQLQNWWSSPLNLGGGGGEDGGSGVPVGDIFGQLIQSKVAFDTTEAAVLDIPVSGASLVTNLNRIRYRLASIESSGAVYKGVGIWDNSLFTASGITDLNFVNLDVTVSGMMATISGGIVVQWDDGHVASGVTILNFEGDGVSSVVDEDHHKVTVTISGGAHALGSATHTDVDTTGVTTGDSLVWDGDEWVPSGVVTSSELWTDETTYLRTTDSRNVIVGSQSEVADGTFHVHVAESPATVGSLADDVIIEGSGHMGMSFLNNDTALSNIQFVTNDGIEAQVRSDPSGSEFIVQGLLGNTLHLIGENMDFETSVGGLFNMNSAGDDADFRVQTGTVVDFFYIDAGNNTVMIDPAGTLGPGGGDGTLHVHTGSAGAVTAATGADELVLEGSLPGLSILAPAVTWGSIYFGDGTVNNAGYLRYGGVTNQMELGVGAVTEVKVTPSQMNFTPAAGPYVLIANTQLNIQAIGAVVVNEFSGDVDFRVEGSTDQYLFFVDAGQDSIGIGTQFPQSLLHASGVVTFNSYLDMQEISEPTTPGPNFFRIYPKANGRLYGKNDDGTEYDLTISGFTTAGQVDHGGLAGLGDDDHSQYALLAGRAGGQTLYGGTAANEDLTLYGTTHATVGHVLIPDNLLHIGNWTATTGAIDFDADVSGKGIIDVRSGFNFGSNRTYLRAGNANGPSLQIGHGSTNGGDIVVWYSGTEVFNLDASAGESGSQLELLGRFTVGNTAPITVAGDSATISASVDDLTITSADDVIIDPTGILQVSGNTEIYGLLDIEVANAAGTTWLDLNTDFDPAGWSYGTFKTAASAIELALRTGYVFGVTGGSVGIGTTATDAPLHIYTGDAGAVTPSADSDELVIEGNGNVGMSFLFPATDQGRITFGHPADNNEGEIIYDPETNTFFFHTASTERLRLDDTLSIFNSGKTNTDFQFRGDNDTNLLYLDGGLDRIGIGIGLGGMDTKLHIAGGITASGYLDMWEIASPVAPSTDRFRVWPASGVIYGRNDVGTIYDLTAGGEVGGGGLGIHWKDETTYLRTTNDRNVIVGDQSVAPDGTFHIHTGSAGSVTAATAADDLVVENSASAGITILSAAGTTGSLYFGIGTDNDLGFIDFNTATEEMRFGIGTTPITMAFAASQLTFSPNPYTIAGAGQLNIQSPTAIRLQANSGDVVINDSGLDADFRVESDASQYMFFLDAASGRAIFNPSNVSTVPDATLHVHTASAGAVAASSSANDFVIESAGDTGMTLLAPFANDSNIYFGAPGYPARGQLTYDVSSSTFTMTSNNDEIYRMGIAQVIFNQGRDDRNFTVYTVNEFDFFHIDAGLDRVGIGVGTNPEGTLHVHTDTAGAVTAHASYDDLIVENNSTAGVSILSPNANFSALVLGHTSNNLMGRLYSNQTGDYVELESAGDLKFQVTGAGDQFIFNENGGDYDLRFLSDDATDILYIDAGADSGAGRLGVGTNAPTSTFHVEQTSTTAAIAVMTLDQSDVSEEFVEFIGTAASGVITQSFVDDGDVATSTVAGWVKILVTDDGNQITDGSYYIPFYTLT